MIPKKDPYEITDCFDPDPTKGIPGPPLSGPGPDPRSPIRQLLDTFALEEEQVPGAQTAMVNTAAAAAAGAGGGAGPAAAAAAAAGASSAGAYQEMRNSDTAAAQAAGAAPVPPAVGAAAGPGGAAAAAAAAAAATADGADVQISAAKIPFMNWHIPESAFPSEYDTPLRMRMADAIAKTVPDPPPPPELELNQNSITAPLEKLLWDAASTLQHAQDITDAVKDRAEKIRQARALMPVIPEGKAIGNLNPQTYTTIIGGVPTTGKGYMFQEPWDSEYGKWVLAEISAKYKEASDRWGAMPDNPAPAKKTAWIEAANAAAVYAITGQEGTPSAINTYDSRILSWGIGLAAPGHLQKVMYFIVRDPKVRKVFYCCGFKYDCKVQHVHGMYTYHGIYQIADLTADPPRVVFGDNFHHREKKGEFKNGEFWGYGFVALKALTAQRELIHMLIQVARDPETRDVVFKHNYDFISRAARVKGAEMIKNEALYVFIAQVQHNWGLQGRDPVRYAISTMDSSEKALASPSDEFDRALAKGVVRLLMKVLQEQRFQNAIKALNSGKYPRGLSKDDPIKNFHATTEWALPRLIENYWKPMQKGTKSFDRSKVEVPGFLVPLDPANPKDSPAPGDYVWEEGGAKYNFGPASRMDLRFEDDAYAVVEIVDSRHVKVRHTKTKVERIEDATPRR